MQSVTTTTHLDVSLASPLACLEMWVSLYVRSTWKHRTKPIKFNRDCITYLFLGMIGVQWGIKCLEGNLYQCSSVLSCSHCLLWIFVFSFVLIDKNTFVQWFLTSLECDLLPPSLYSLLSITNKDLSVAQLLIIKHKLWQEILFHFSSFKWFKIVE